MICIATRRNSYANARCSAIRRSRHVTVGRRVHRTAVHDRADGALPGRTGETSTRTCGRPAGPAGGGPCRRSWPSSLHGGGRPSRLPGPSGSAGPRCRVRSGRPVPPSRVAQTAAPTSCAEVGAAVSICPGIGIRPAEMVVHFSPSIRVCAQSGGNGRGIVSGNRSGPAQRIPRGPRPR